MRTVFCSKYQQELPGLERAPMPGKKGEDILNNVSKQAWQEWREMQTMLINENNLNLIDVKSREFINQQMQLFLNTKDYKMPEHYVPPK
jgi:Fe-S cluster biosynthesis and repair protein YggX